MGLLSSLKEKLTGGKKEEEEFTTNLTPSLEKSLVYWHAKGNIDEAFIKKLKNVNSFDAAKIIDRVKKSKK